MTKKKNMNNINTQGKNSEEFEVAIVSDKFFTRRKFLELIYVLDEKGNVHKSFKEV